MDHHIEFRHLRYFVTVAEELHFGRAAQRLHLAQPPLSQQIRKLEELLGYSLFTRNSRSVALTAPGEAFLQSARRTLRNVQRDVDEARSIGRGEIGSLHTGFIGSAMLTDLPARLREYTVNFPSVRLRLHEAFTSTLLEGLENGSLDAAILRDGGPTEGLRTVTTLTSTLAESAKAEFVSNGPSLCSMPEIVGSRIHKRNFAQVSVSNCG